MSEKNIDRLSALIQHFHIDARANAGEVGNKIAVAANFFVIGRDAKFKSHTEDDYLAGVTNSLVFFPRGLPENLLLNAIEGSEYVSAFVDAGSVSNPISLALPDVIVVPLEKAPELQSVTDILLEEVLSPRCGGQTVIDRLCEIVIIRRLRHMIEQGRAQIGLVGGLAHPNLSTLIVAIHENPAKNWHLEDMADVAGMSRTRFANSFRDVMGVTPGDYLSQWRLTLTRLAIAKGESLKSIVGKVGFSSSAALSRAYKRQYGVSPRQDL